MKIQILTVGLLNIAVKEKNMSNNTKVNASASASGIGFCGLLTIVFIVLKLIGKITWSWVWVLAPMWVPFVLAILFIICVFIVLRK